MSASLLCVHELFSTELNDLAITLSGPHIYQGCIYTSFYEFVYMNRIFMLRKLHTLCVSKFLYAVVIRLYHKVLFFFYM